MRKTYAASAIAVLARYSVGESPTSARKTQLKWVNDCIGFSWPFTPETLHLTARALEPVNAVFFYGTLLQEDCELDPSLGYELALRAGRVLMGRMEALIGILLERIQKRVSNGIATH